MGLKIKINQPVSPHTATLALVCPAKCHQNMVVVSKKICFKIV
jgi:hypothetical protein